MFIEENWSIGSVVKKMREEQGLTLQQLSSGLCSVVTLSRIENGERDMDILLATAILGRLGYRLDKYEFFGSLEEFEQWNQRQDMEHWRQMNDFKMLENTLEQYENRWYNSITENVLQYQFIEFMKGTLALQNGDVHSGIKLFESAMTLTVPEWHQENYKFIALSELELEILDAVCDAYELAGMKNPSYNVRTALVTYLRMRNDRRTELLKMYIEQICKAAPVYLDRGKSHELLELCEDGLKELGRQNRIFCWPELLYCKCQALEKLFECGQAERSSVLKAFQEAYYIYLLFDDQKKAEEISIHLEEHYAWKCKVYVYEK